MSERTNFERTILKMNRVRLVQLLEDAILLYQDGRNNGLDVDAATVDAVHTLLDSLAMQVDLDSLGLGQKPQTH